MKVCTVTSLRRHNVRIIFRSGEKPLCFSNLVARLETICASDGIVTNNSVLLSSDDVYGASVHCSWGHTVEESGQLAKRDSPFVVEVVLSDSRVKTTHTIDSIETVGTAGLDGLSEVTHGKVGEARHDQSGWDSNSSGEGNEAFNETTSVPSQDEGINIGRVSRSDSISLDGPVTVANILMKVNEPSNRQG